MSLLKTNAQPGGREGLAYSQLLTLNVKLPLSVGSCRSIFIEAVARSDRNKIICHSPLGRGADAGRCIKELAGSCQL